jgi:membrane-bound lytic murein transglycosylase B
VSTVQGMSRVLAAGLLAVTLAACTPERGEERAAPTAADTSTPSPSPASSPSPLPSPSPTGPVAAQLPPTTAADPAGLAAQIVTAERTIRSDADADNDGTVAEAGRVQQAAYRALAARPEWRPAVLEAVPTELHDTVVAHTDAVAGLRRLARPQPRLPSWRIVAPPPAEELLAHYREGEQRFGVGWEYLAAIHLVETRMGRIRGTSPAGARGPMQFMPQTWAAYGEGDVDDPRDAVLAAARYLKASGAPGDMPRALFAYNRSQAYVQAVEVHAAQMRADPRTYRGYYHWQVYYRTTQGDRILPVGYDGRR